SATAETETLIFLKQWRTELEHDRFVSDYSLFHVLAYADWVMENAAERKENHLWREAREIATYGLSDRYDHVFYLPIEFPIVPDTPTRHAWAGRDGRSSPYRRSNVPAVTLRVPTKRPRPCTAVLAEASARKHGLAEVPSEARGAAQPAAVTAMASATLATRA